MKVRVEGGEGRNGVPSDQVPSDQVPSDQVLSDQVPKAGSEGEGDPADADWFDGGDDEDWDDEDWDDEDWDDDCECDACLASGAEDEDDVLQLMEERNARRSAQAVLATCLATRIGGVAREIRRDYARALREYELTPAQFAVLATIIAAREPVRSSAVGRALSLEKSSVSRAVGRLIARGLVGVDLAEDMASPALSIEPCGLALFRRAYPAWGVAQERGREWVAGALEAATSVLGGPGSGATATAGADVRGVAGTDANVGAGGGVRGEASSRCRRLSSRLRPFPRP